MNHLQLLRNRLSSLEQLETRTLLDVGLGSEIVAFADESEMQSFLVDHAVSQNEWRFGQPVIDNCFYPTDALTILPRCGDVFYWRVDDLNTDFLAVADFGGVPEAGVADTTFSDTNVQVAGVDEGDIVETDGNFVYILSGNQVVIVDVQDQTQPRIASRVELGEGTHGIEMYLDGDRLMVISNAWGYFDDIVPLIDIEPAIGFSDALFYPGEPMVTATVIDITDREAPSIVSSTEIDGSVTTSRAIDGMAFLIVSDHPRYPEVGIVTQEVVDEDGETVTQRYYESEKAYRERVAPLIVDAALTSYETADAAGTVVSAGLVSEFDSTYRSTKEDYYSLVSVVSINMHAELPSVEDATTIMMDAGHEIYMDNDSLYLFQARWNREQTTSIMKFDVDAEQGEATPTASGIVPGRMLDQFSADEYGGNLRIATTTGWGEESSSGVYVLEQVEDNLALAGGVSGLAPGERIFSARFLGDRGYVVTFRQVDPLFSINLSDPANPVVEGELKIPGFSEYMQPIDENHLLAIGRDADPLTGRSQGLQLSLFDVEDITSPKLVDRYTFEGLTSTWSPAEHDHHAFGYYPEYDTLAIPVQSTNGGTWIRGEDGLREWIPATWDQSLHVFQVDVDAGFDFVGAVEHPSQVQRSLRVGAALYSVSYDTLKVNSITDPSVQFGMVHYLKPQNGGVIPVNPDAEDIDRIFAEAATEQNDRKFDLDGNSVVNRDDAIFMIEAVLETKPGDADLDGDIDFRDFLELVSNFGNEGGWADGDFNGDGMVNFEDFTILANSYGN